MRTQRPEPETAKETAKELARDFCAAWSAAAAAGVRSPSATAALGAGLEAALAEGRTAWPHVALGGSVFAAHLGRLLAQDATAGAAPAGSGSGGSGAVAQTLTGLHVADLFLACACASGIGKALELFETRYLRPLPEILRGLQVPVDGIDEVQAALRHKLLLAGDDGHPPRIAAYAGRGPLAGWVAIAAQRTALSLRRGAGAQKRAHERAMTEAIAAELDPELRYVKARYRGAFEAAFRETLRDLGDRDRALLRLSLVGGLSLEALGVSYQVNASTVSRWLAKIRRNILDGTVSRLRERLRLSATEVASIARLLTSQMDVSVMRLLVTEAGGRRSEVARE